MLDFQQKRKIQRVIYNWITLAIIFLLVLIVGHSTWTVYQKKQTSEETKKISLQNVEKLRERNEELDSKISRLETTIGVEEEIRSKFNVVKEEENAVVVVEEEKEEISTTSPKFSFWQRIINLFKN